MIRDSIKYSYKMMYIMFWISMIAITNAGFIEARGMNRAHYCGCAKKVSNERDDAYKKLNNAVRVSENIITYNNCPAGKEFKYDNYEDNYKIECSNCSDNYYRTAVNNTCLHCPIGYYSKSGDSECTKATPNTPNINVYTYCNKGYITGTNKFAEYHNSCYKCNPEKKQFMPYQRNDDACLICPEGSVVDEKAITCIECPVGYYEKNNKCIECDIGSYNDKTGSGKCNVCNNEKAIAYHSVGGYNCDDSVFYELSEVVKSNLINTDALLKPMAYCANLGIALISNNRRLIELAIPFAAMSYVAISM